MAAAVAWSAGIATVVKLEAKLLDSSDSPLSISAWLSPMLPVISSIDIWIAELHSCTEAPMDSIAAFPRSVAKDTNGVSSRPSMACRFRIPVITPLNAISMGER